MIWNEIVCLGDSLTYGARDEYGRSYPAELSRILSDHTGEYWFCHNYGVNGETTSDIMHRCWQVFRSHSKAKIVNLLVGTNDTKIPIPLEIFRDNITQIIRAAQVHDMYVVLGTLPPLQFCPFYLKNREYIQLYSDEIKRIASEMQLPICDLSGLGEYLVDGVHFTHQGYVEMAKLWAAKILSL